MATQRGAHGRDRQSACTCAVSWRGAATGARRALRGDLCALENCGRLRTAARRPPRGPWSAPQRRFWAPGVHQWPHHPPGCGWVVGWWLHPSPAAWPLARRTHLLATVQLDHDCRRAVVDGEDLALHPRVIAGRVLHKDLAPHRVRHHRVLARGRALAGRALAHCAGARSLARSLARALAASEVPAAQQRPPPPPGAVAASWLPRSAPLPAAPARRGAVLEVRPRTHARARGASSKRPNPQQPSDIFTPYYLDYDCRPSGPRAYGASSSACPLGCIAISSGVR